MSNIQFLRPMCHVLRAGDIDVGVFEIMLWVQKDDLEKLILVKCDSAFQMSLNWQTLA